MEKDKILQSDFLDVLFEDRNKLYGAYELRKKYNKRLIIAMALGLLVIALPAAYILFGNLNHKLTEPNLVADIYVLPTIPILETQPTSASTKKINKAVKKKVIAARNANGAVKIVKETQLVALTPVTENVLTVSSLQPSGAGSIDAPEAIGNSESIETTPYIASVPITDPNLALPVAEQMPSFPGGKQALSEFLQNNLEAPRPLAEGERVEVRIKFVVGFDGYLKSFEVLKDGGNLFNKEVIRVLKRMPRWIPGKNGGKRVSVYFSLPVSFVAPE